MSALDRAIKALKENDRLKSDMDILCIVDHASIIIEADKAESEDK